MLMEVKNQFKVLFLSVRYALQREMLNKATFLSNIIFMMLNNASFIIQWLIIYSIKTDVGGYTFKMILLLWGIAALTYGISRFFFIEAFELSDAINLGKLDNYLVQPKNVLLSFITGKVEVSAIGDIIYGIIMIALFDITKLPIFIFTGILGGFVIVSISIIFSSLAFWFGKVETFSNTINSIMTNFATYPEGIFKGLIKILFYTILPLGFSTYLPVNLICNFNIYQLLLLIGATILFVSLAFIIFYKGLRRYSSTNLMNARI